MDGGKIGTLFFNKNVETQIVSPFEGVLSSKVEVIEKVLS